MPSRLLVVHATSLLRKGRIVAKGERVDEQGRSTKALFEIAKALRRALSFKTPELAVALIEPDDGPQDEPQAHDDERRRLEPVLTAHGIPMLEVPDALTRAAAFVESAVSEGHDVVIVGSDKRLAQLVRDKVWWYDAFKDVRYTAELVRKRFDVGPEHVAGWLALTGDDDQLPGIPGIGKKGSTDLVKAFGSIEAALTRAEEVTGRTGKMLRQSLELARAEVERATLRHDPANATAASTVPVDVTKHPFSPAPVAELNRLYAELGFQELLLATHDGSEGEVQVVEDDDAVAQALALFTEEPVAMHAITEDPSPPRGTLVGVALVQPPHAIYVPLCSRTGAPREVPPSLAAWLGDEARPKLGHNAKSAVVAFARRGLELRGVAQDSACSSHLAQPSNYAPHDIEIVARMRLSRALDDDDAVRGVGRGRKRWCQVPIARAASHAAARARASIELVDAFREEIDVGILDEYLELSKTLVRMELKGLLCDRADLARAGEDFTRIGEELETRIFELAGKSFNLGSTKQLGTVLYEDLGLPVYKRTKTGWSTATDALERIENAHPIVPLVIRVRQLVRLRDAWVTALIAAIDEDGRVRSSVDPARSFSGRLVNSSPDLGRVPGKTPEMARIRHAFCAPPGWVLMSVDYEQLGLHVLAHLTRDPALVEPLRRRADMHTLTAAAVLDLPEDRITVDQRQVGKVVNFATFAGQGASALALQLGVAAQEAKQIIARFDARYAKVRAFQDGQLEKVRSHGYVETIVGRRWPIDGLDSEDQQLRAYAERLARRATHEGSVADVSRRGLLRADQALRRAGSRAVPLLQVHDEVLFEVPADEVTAAARIAKEAMRDAFETEVPLQVSCEAGPNWAELSPVAES